MFITSKKFMTGDEKRLIVVHLGFSNIDKVAKNNLQSLKNSVLTCIIPQGTQAQQKKAVGNIYIYYLLKILIWCYYTHE